MADPPPPHPHQGIWLWMAGAWMLIGGGVVSGYLVRAKRFDVTSPLMLVAFTCGVLAVVCVIGAVRGWRFPFTKRQAVEIHETEAHEQPYNMDGFNELRDVTRPSYGVGNVFASEPGLLENSDAGPYEPPPQESALWKPASPPSFQAEFRRAREIDRGYDGSEGAIAAIEEWTQDVYDKLHDWMARHAETFETWSMNDIAISAGASLTGEHIEDDHHRELKTRVARLHRILDS